MTEMLIDPKRDFTIECPDGVALVIKDRHGRRGGNLRTRGGRRVAWTNEARDADCFLRFTRLLPDDVESPGNLAIWPFCDDEPDDEDAPEVRLLRLPFSSRVTVTLPTPAELDCIEYVVLGPTGQPLLDPVIIIEPQRA